MLSTHISTNNGKFVSLTNIGTLISGLNSYGANSTVNYVTGIYDSVSTITGNIPHMKIDKNSYIEIIIYNHFDLLIFTPYCYNYGNDTVFGSIDKSIYIDNNKPIKICCTPNRFIAEFVKADILYPEFQKTI